MRRSWAAAAGLLMAVGLVAGCTAAGGPDGASASPSPSPGIRLVAPQAPVAAGDEVRIIVQVDDAGGPVADQEVTFDVLSGPAAYPDGFDSDRTDGAGTATSLTLHPSGSGAVRIRVAAGAQSAEFTVTLE